jgi:predicted XRE-type DNA-binding protein
MASRAGARKKVVRGSSNVFADLGYPDAEERQTKLRLAHAINTAVAAKRLTQSPAARRLGVSQPKVSALANYQLDGFSVERLMTFLTALDQDVDIVIRRKPRSRSAGRIAAIKSTYSAMDVGAGISIPSSLSPSI